MDERFPLTGVPPAVAEIAGRLRAAGHEAWYVGGAVRDALLKSSGRHAVRRGDFDIATSATPVQVVAIFRRTVPVGIEHGTVAVLDETNKGHEVTTFRKDVRTDGRHAEVEFGVSLEEDLARRDFTINAIAIHPESGEIRDPFDGRKDLAAGVLRAVGDAATRFREDRLRVLRGLRFAATFGLAIEPSTWAAILASAGDLSHLSRERVRDEWVKMLGAADPSRAVTLWRTAKVLEKVWPELAGLDDDAIALLDGVQPQDPVLFTAAALAWAGVDESIAGAAMSRLRFSNRETARVVGIVAAERAGAPNRADAVALRRWVARHRAVAADVAAVTRDASERGALGAAVATILESGAPLAIGELAIAGNDLVAAGIPAGPLMGVILRLLLDDVLADPALNTRDTLLARARSIAGS